MTVLGIMMHTQHDQYSLDQISMGFHAEKRVDLAFDAPEISSDGGLLLLRLMDDKRQFTETLATFLPDNRETGKVKHTRLEQLRQRIYQIALGYKDQNASTQLCRDRLLKTVLGHLPDDEKSLSSQPSISRFEHSATARDIVLMQREFEDMYVANLAPDTDYVSLDIDGTGNTTHGQQEFAFYNGYYGSTVYFPLLVFDGDGELVTYRMRPGNAGNYKGATALITRLVRKIKARFPECVVFVRGDCAFSYPLLLDTLDCLNDELGNVRYALGFSKNRRILRMVASEIEQARLNRENSLPEPHVYKGLMYQADTWKKERYVVGKLDCVFIEPVARFVVTNLDCRDPQSIYEDMYCPRGDAENRIKDFKCGLRGDRHSNTTFVANAFRMSLHAFAYRLLNAVRREAGEISPDLGHVQFDTLRLRLLKVATIVRQSVRRISLHMPLAYPLAEAFKRLALRIGGFPRPRPFAALYAA